jgi:hypothetical protein
MIKGEQGPEEENCDDRKPSDRSQDKSENAALPSFIPRKTAEFIISAPLLAEALEAFCRGFAHDIFRQTSSWRQLIPLRITLAGTPTQMLCSGSNPLTTDFVPITEWSPIDEPFRTVTSLPSQT